MKDDSNKEEGGGPNLDPEELKRVLKNIKNDYKQRSDGDEVDEDNIKSKFRFMFYIFANIV